MVYSRINETLELELVSPYNAEKILEIVNRNREHLSRYLSWVDETKTIEPIIENTRKALISYADMNGIAYVIKLNGEIIGRISIWEAEKETCIFEVGYWIDKEYERKGIMTACVKRVIGIGFKYLKAKKIEICCIDENIGSNRIPQKLGFTKEGIRRKSNKIGNKIYDMIIYGLLEREYLERKESFI